MLDNVEFAAALREAVRIRCDAWSGTTSELLTMVPGAAADGTRLARRLTDAAADLAAAGVTVERRRQPGTGARLLVLRLVAAEGSVEEPLRATALNGAADGPVTLSSLHQQAIGSEPADPAMPGNAGISRGCDAATVVAFDGIDGAASDVAEFQAQYARAREAGELVKTHVGAAQDFSILPSENAAVGAERDAVSLIFGEGVAQALRGRTALPSAGR
jgi:hypothetical protein